MNDDRMLERAARSWLEDGPTQAPDRAVDAALARIQTTNQERDLRIPWRLPSMNRAALLAASLATIAVVVTVGIYAFRPVGNIGGPNRSLGSPTPIATPAPTSVAFKSARHGYRLDYPAGWTPTPATAPWPIGAAAPGPPSDELDTFADPNGAQTFVVVSQSLGSQTSDVWLADYEQSAPLMPPACWPTPPAMETATISGQVAWIHGGIAGCGFTEAVVFAGGRVYELTGYSRQPEATFDRSTFDAIIATIILDPSSADDTPVASPGAS
jgi:hypothetical protein